jgi:uncharacterized protein YjbI with pentapeptide repeats
VQNSPNRSSLEKNLKQVLSAKDVMMKEGPIHTDNPLFLLLKEDNVGEFNQRRSAGEFVNLEGCHLRGCDLRGLNAEGLSMKNAYLRGADLRGVDFRNAELEGASLAHAKISGSYFSNRLDANEINLSVQHGTRLRYRRSD